MEKLNTNGPLFYMPEGSDEYTPLKIGTFEMKGNYAETEKVNTLISEREEFNFAIDCKKAARGLKKLGKIAKKVQREEKRKNRKATILMLLKRHKFKALFGFILHIRGIAPKDVYSLSKKCKQLGFELKTTIDETSSHSVS